MLDDLHWSDRPTLLLLRHLARAPQASGLRVLGAYRAAEHGTEGFAPALAGLRHERLMRELEVRGLPESDATELIRLRTLETPSAAFVRALYTGTEGNPFFIEEMVRHLVDSGVRLARGGRRRAAALRACPTACAGSSRGGSSASTTTAWNASRWRR